MSHAETERKVKEILAEKLSIDPAGIQPVSRLLDDLGMDSVLAIEILFELEEAFDVRIAEADIVKAKTVKDIVDYMAAKGGAGPE